MTDKNIGNVREHLLQSLARVADQNLRGDALREEIDRAEVINATSGRICETVKVQTDRMKVLEQLQSPDRFLEGEVTQRQITQGSGNE